MLANLVSHFFLRPPWGPLAGAASIIYSFRGQLALCPFPCLRGFWISCAFIFVLGFADVPPVSALTLYPEASSKTDLLLKGELVGLPAGAKRFIRHADLLELPTTLLQIKGEFSEETKQVTALFLSDLWSALPCEGRADTLLANCTDGYASVYTTEFVRRFRPFLILRIDGHDPENWAVGKAASNPGPYIIMISAEVVPAVAQLLDSNHKRPWGVTELEVANYADKFRALSDGPWESLSHAGKAGREIWLNSCFSCHQGPPGAPGGTKSDRPFIVLAVHAAQNPDYFKRYIRDPQAVVPNAKMEKHAYTDAQFDDLIAFITADGQKKL